MNGGKKEPRNLLRRILNGDLVEAELYEEVFLHSSSNTLPNNQRLAFLGDSVLRLIIREHFYHEHPDWDKEELTDASKDIELNDNFAKLAVGLEMKEHMDIKNPPADKEGWVTLNAEAFEALFGAIYLNRGYEEAKRIAERLILDRVNTSL